MKNIRVRGNLTWKKIGGEVVVIDTRHSQSVHKFNDVGSLIWENIDKNEAEIIDLIMSEFSVEKNEALSDLRDYIQKLIGLGLVLV